MYRSSIDKEEINLLPLGHFKGIVTLVERKQDVASIISRLAEEPILGFDTETKPSFKKGKGNKVSLLQLSSARKAWLFRLNHTGLPVSLAMLLENPNIIKVGVAIHDDLKALNNLRKFSPGGFIELGEAPEKSALRELKEETGLTGQIHKLLGVDTNHSDRYGTVLIVGYLVKKYTGTLRADDDASDAGYFHAEKLPEIAFDSHMNFIRKYYSSSCL